MSLCSLLLLLLLLLVCSVRASHFYGTVMTYHPKNTDGSGSIEVVVRYKLNFHKCSEKDDWSCKRNCGTESTELHVVVEESSGEWCQREGVMTRLLPSNAPFDLELDAGNWISNKNGISDWRAVTLVELRNRSDTGRANRSPQTTILPALRVPSNCQRNLTLLAFDADGDEVRCRYGSTSQSECNPCTPPSVLNLAPSCVLSFSPTSSSNDVGAYAVQLVMEDFPRENINLTDTSGSQEVKSTNNAISKLPVQFAFRVDSAVPSCTEGLYLPKFLSPTPANGARLYVAVNQTLEIPVSAEANISRISELLVSGPYDMNNTKETEGEFILRWTPSDREDGESHAVCFVAQAILNSDKYHSELRCITMSVTSEQTTTTTIEPTTVQQSTSAQEPVISDATSTQSVSVTTPEHTTPSQPTTTQSASVTTPEHTTPSQPTTTQSASVTTPEHTTPSQPTTTQSASVTTPEHTTPSQPATTQSASVTTPEHTTPSQPTTTQSASVTTPESSQPTTTQSASVPTPEHTTPSQPATTQSASVATPEHTTPSQPATTQSASVTTPEHTTPSQPTTTQRSSVTTPEDTTPSQPTSTQSASVTTPENTTPPPPAADQDSTQDQIMTTTMGPTTVQQSTSAQDPVISDTTTTQSASVTTPGSTTPSPSTQVVVGLRIKISSLSPLTEDFLRNTVLQQLKDELLRRGVLPSDATLRLLSSTGLGITPTAPSAG